MKPKKPKFYAVWKGRNPGVYARWEDASFQIHKFPGAIFESFGSMEAAQKAFQGPAPQYRKSAKNAAQAPKGAKDRGFVLSESGRVERATAEARPRFVSYAMAVDAACSGVPGPMEYRGVWIATGEQVFHCGPMEDGTNNVGEFLAIVHAAAWLKREGRLDVPIYSDSYNAIKWVQSKACRTKLAPGPRNVRIFELIDRAVKWLGENQIANPVLKWETRQWGENPADFGRK